MQIECLRFSFWGVVASLVISHQNGLVYLVEKIRRLMKFSTFHCQVQFFVFKRIIYFNSCFNQLGPVVPFHGEMKSPHLALIFDVNSAIMTNCRKTAKRAIV